MSQHGNAKVRPDGKVNVGVAIDDYLYRVLWEWSRKWDMTMGEVIEKLISDAWSSS